MYHFSVYLGKYFMKSKFINLSEMNINQQALHEHTPKINIHVSTQKWASPASCPQAMEADIL